MPLLDEKLDLIFEFLILISGVTMILMEEAIFGFVCIRTSSKGSMHFHIGFISNRIEDLC